MFWNFILIIGALIGIGIVISILSQKSKHQILSNKWRLLSVESTGEDGVTIIDTDKDLLIKLIQRSYLDLNRNGSFRSQFLNNPLSEGLWKIENDNLVFQTQFGTEKLKLVHSENHKFTVIRQVENKSITLHYGL